MESLQSQSQIVGDANDLPVIRSKAGARASDRLLSSDQVSAIQRNAAPAEAFAPAAPVSAPAPLPAPPAASGQAIPVPALAPLTAPTDLDARISRMFGAPAPQVDPAVAALHQKVDALFARLQPGAAAIPQNHNAYTNQYGSAAPSQDGPLTRDDLMQALDQQRREFGQALAFQNARSAAQAAVDAEFPQLSRDPALRAAADRILAGDLSLQRDPSGPLKAAAIAIGLANSGAAPRVPGDVQKAAMSGLGGGSAESSVPVDPNRYAQAIEYAKRTGDLSDFARARRIQLGQE